MTRAIKIADLSPTGGLAFDLIDIVSLLGERASRSHWRASNVWTVQEGDSGRFEDLCAEYARIPGEAFLASLANVMQVIDGRFAALDADSEQPWVMIEAVDSSYFVLHATDDIIAEARGRFHSVSDYPHEPRG